MTIPESFDAQRELTPESTSGDLESRLRAIEERGLADRAPGYVNLHDEMRERLEGGDAPHLPTAE